MDNSFIGKLNQTDIRYHHIIEPKVIGDSVGAGSLFASGASLDVGVTLKNIGLATANITVIGSTILGNGFALAQDEQVFIPVDNVLKIQVSAGDVTFVAR